MKLKHNKVIKWGWRRFDPTQWRTKDNRVYKIEEMGTAHLRNCIKYMKKRGRTKLRCLVEGNPLLYTIENMEKELKRRINNDYEKEDDIT